MVSHDSEELDYVDDMVDPDDQGSINGEKEDELSSSPHNDDDVTVSMDTGTAMGLGKTSSSLTEEQLIMNNPHLKKLLNKMLDERIQNARTNGESSHSELLTGKESHKEPNRGNVVKIMKSPSDTMIYVPALKRRAINKDRIETDNFRNLQADLDSVANKNTNSIAENSGRRIESDAAAMLNI